ncbi:hypothetical protein HNP65_000307 [Thermosipho japonicus]|uniref:Uncharacterized protein n=1 Tax=Thermosipho japonicus TaxID=90323 RepID=A0A841GIQ2_9BACT|nr:hypothetical protein [Thermosipho japonicus]MBB6061885.1 hypothetical protein [Thermosipho japonicus]
MSLFASNETVKLYIKDKKVVNKESDTWIEVPKELTAELREEAVTIFQNSKVEVTRDGNAILDLAAVNAVPYKFLTKVIKSWSESVPVNLENIKKVEATTLLNIWIKLQEMYNLGGSNAFGV